MGIIVIGIHSSIFPSFWRFSKINLNFATAVSRKKLGRQRRFGIPILANLAYTRTRSYYRTTDKLVKLLKSEKTFFMLRLHEKHTNLMHRRPIFYWKTSPEAVHVVSGKVPK